jgi:hypothetical protein
MSRDELLTKMGNLRAQRGAAVLDGRPFDVTALSTVSAALEAQDDAEAETLRRERAAAAQAAAERHGRLVADVASVDTARMASLAAAQEAAHAMVTHLGHYRHASAQLVALARGAGAPVPMSITWLMLARRLGSMIGAALKVIASGPNALGNLEWHSDGLDHSDWLATERRASAREIAEIIERTRP